MTQPIKLPQERLRHLLKLVSSGQLSVSQFCSDFERIYNLETDKFSLSASEREAFSAVFEKVVWFSPYPDERARIPNYLGESDILAAVDEALRVLGLQVT
jgi:hypothetical protein